MREFNVLDPIGSLYENSFKLTQLGGRTAKPIESNKKLVNFVCYCINPNHYHFILEQLTDGGISEFMKRLSGGYTWYFDNKHKRSGALFQGRFKSVHIGSNEYLLRVSAYVNLNWRVHQLGGSTAKLVKSSWGEYVEKEKKVLCEKGIILEQFRNRADYKKFAEDSLQSTLEQRQRHKVGDLDNLLLE